MRPVDPRLLRYAGTTRRFLALTVLVGLASAACILVQAELLARMITDGFLGGDGLAALRGPLLWLAVVVVVRAALAWAQEALAAGSSARVKEQLRSALLRHVTRLGPGWLARRGAAEIVSSATRGIDALDPYFARYLPQLVLAVLVPPLVIVRMGIADAISGAIVLITLPLIPVFMVLVGWSTQKLTRRQWRSLELLSRHFLDVVEGLPTLRVFGRAKAQVSTIARVTDDYRRTTLKVLRVSFLSAFVLELTATLSVALVAVGVGLRLIDATVALQTALLVLILAPEAYLPLRQVGTHYHAATEGVAAAERIFEVLETSPPDAGDVLVDLRRAPLEVHDVHVTDEGSELLAGLDLQLAPGEFVALTGPSGCGKTTLLRVLLRFTEHSSGSVQAGGTDLAVLDPVAWRRQIAWMPQRPSLIAGTVRDNVRLGLPQLSDSAVRLAMRRAAVDEIDPDLIVGEDGRGLSGGQRQRVALARAFARMEGLDTALLLLDEPTAHVDPATEARIAEVLRELAGKRTILLVAHSPALAAAADRTLEMVAMVAA